MDGFMSDMDSLDLPSLSMSEDSPESLIYDGHCPSVEVVNELRDLYEFTNRNEPQQQNMISRATIAKIETACQNSENAVTVDLKMAFEGTLGPRGRSSTQEKPFFSYPFFVAVTSANGRILAKEIFAANITYEAGKDYQTYYENMRQIIPIEARDSGNRYKILVGFQLGPDQLTYNRAKMTSKPALLEGNEIQPAQRVSGGTSDAPTSIYTPY